MARHTHQFNLRLDDETATMLDALALQRKICKAHVIRELIQNRHTMLNRSIPICSDGNGCVMATAWLQNSGALLVVKQGQLHQIPEVAAAERDADQVA